MRKISTTTLLLCILLISTNAYSATIQYDVSGSANFYYGNDFTSREYSLEIVGCLTMSDDISEVITIADGYEDYLLEQPGHTVAFESFYFEIGDQYVFQGTDASTYYANGLDYYASFNGFGDFSSWWIWRGEYAAGEFYTGPDYVANVHTFAYPDSFRLYSGDGFTDTGFAESGNLYYVDLVCTRSMPVPEPATMLLFGIGIAGIIGKRKLSKGRLPN